MCLDRFYGGFFHLLDRDEAHVQVLWKMQAFLDLVETPASVCSRAIWGEMHAVIAIIQLEHLRTNDECHAFPVAASFLYQGTKAVVVFSSYSSSARIAAYRRRNSDE